MLVIHDTTPPAAAAIALSEDPESSILSISSRPPSPLTYALREAADQIILFRTPVRSALGSIECASSSFLEYYTRGRSLPFGRITALESLGLVGYLDGELGARFGPGSGLVDLSVPLQAEITREAKRDVRRLVVAMGSSSVPVDVAISDLLLRFGITKVNVIHISQESMGQTQSLVRIERSVVGLTSRFSSQVVLLLLCCYLAREKSVADQPIQGVNVTRVSQWAMRSGLAELLPAQRGERRAESGLEAALRKSAYRLIEEGLLTVYERRRPGPRWEFFRLTNLGYSYAQVLLQMSSYLPEEHCVRLLDEEVIQAAKESAGEYVE